MKNIIEKDFDPIPEQYSDDMNNLLKKCLTKDPEQRPSVKEILEYEFLKKYLETKTIKDQRKTSLKIDLPTESPIKEKVSEGNLKFNYPSEEIIITKSPIAQHKKQTQSYVSVFMTKF